MTLREIARASFRSVGCTPEVIDFACSFADTLSPTEETELEIPACYEKTMIRLFLKRNDWTEKDAAKWKEIVDRAKGRESFSA